MRYVFVDIFGFFWLTPKAPEWPKNDLKNSKNCRIFLFYAIFCQIIDKFPGFECWKQSKEKIIVIQEVFQRNKCTFLMKKLLKLRPKLTKILENSELWKFYAIFVFFFENLVA